MILVAITLAVYLERAWVARRARKSAPPPAPASVERQSQELSFSKMEGKRTLFTVHAVRSTEYKGNSDNVLEDVHITIFGRNGERHDTMHTRSCQYSKESGRIACMGDVQMDLQSAADAARAGENAIAASARVVHVETRHVTFDRETGIAETDQPVRFVFPAGECDAIGVRYQSDLGMVRLARDVRMTLRSGQAGAGPNAEREVSVRGASLEYRRDARVLRLLGPAEAVTGTERLSAGVLDVFLDAGYHAQRLVASPGSGGAQPELRTQQARGESTVSADSFVAHFASSGWIEKVEAIGAVRGRLDRAEQKDQFEATRMDLGFWPRVQRPREITLTGDVSLRTSIPKTGETRAMQTSALRVSFSGEKENEASRPVRAETLAAASVDWTERVAAGAARPAQTKLRAERMSLDFGPQGQAQALNASGNVQMQRQIPGRPVQTATGRSGTATLAASGGWTQVELRDDVRLSEGDRRAQADRATLQRADQTAVLTGNASVRDSTMVTQAERITFLQQTWNMRAEGGVKSTELSPGKASVNLAAEPANLTADALAASSQLGRAEYKGHARLWQGSSVLEADAITLLKAPRILQASGSVRAAFPQAELPAGGGASPATATKKPGRTALWHVQSGTLTYSDTEGRAHLEKDVVAASEAETIRAPLIDLYFSRSGNNRGQQISCAFGTGGVTIEQGDRRGTAEQGEYTAAEGKFVLSGGAPTLYDGLRGTTTGRQLTFFLADDTIIVDSEKGSRTLTKHRVER